MPGDETGNDSPAVTSRARLRPPADGLKEPHGRGQNLLMSQRHGALEPGGPLRLSGRVRRGRRAGGRELNASVMSAHTAGKIISIVTVETADPSSAIAVALAILSKALRRPVVSLSR